MKILIHLRYLMLVAFATFQIAAVAAEKKAYIVDSLPMVFRTGPTADYRMLSGLVTGDGVEILEVDEEHQTTKVKTSKGKIGWVQSQYIVTTEGAKSRLIKLQQQLNTLRQQSVTNTQKQQKLTQQQTAISARNLQLQRQNTELRNSLEIEQQKSLRLSDKKRNEPMIFGGIIALASLLIGWILARVKPKRGNWR